MKRFDTAAAGAVRLLLIGALCLVPAVLSAQTQTPPDPVSSQPGPLSIERIEDGYVIAPEARITEVDGRTGGLAGVYGGWLMDRSLPVGSA